MGEEQEKYTKGEFLTTQKEMEGVGKNLKGQWETQMWIHQQKQNNLLRLLIKQLTVTCPH